MTKLESLKLCSEMWRWFEKHPEVYSKEEVPLLKSNPAYLECFACEYVYRLTEGLSLNCSLCPLHALWTKALSKDDYGAAFLCEKDPKSPWLRWLGTDENTNKGNCNIRQKAAKKIADFCDKEIKRLLCTWSVLNRI